MLPPINHKNNNVNNNLNNQDTIEKNPINKIAVATIATNFNVPPENNSFDILDERLKKERKRVSNLDQIMKLLLNPKYGVVLPEFNLSIDNFHISFLADIREQLENQFCLNLGISLDEDCESNIQLL